MPKLPHIIIFNPDQWRGDVMGHLGNPAAVTPNLDKIAQEEGVSFRNAFCQNPVCTPSRCSFMTGLYPHVRGHRTMHHMIHSDRDETNLLKILKEAGYFVWWGGKNDLIPGQQDPQEYCDVRYTGPREDAAKWNCTPKPAAGWPDNWRGEAGGDRYYGFLAGKLDKGEEPYYCDKDWRVFLEAQDFLRNYDGEKPLCLFLAIGYPHPPYGIEEPYYSMIDAAQLPERTPAPDSWADKPCMLEGIAGYQKLHTWPEERWTELRKVYYGMCARVDHQFGMLMETLREKNMYDNSAVFAFADHGDFTGDYGLVEKTQNTFQDCLTRVPFLCKPPAGIAVQPGVRDQLTELVDFSATIFELTGINPGYAHFGRSLLPMLADASVPHRDAAFCEGGRRPGEMEASERESYLKNDPPEKGLYWPRVGLQQRDDKPWHGKAAMCRTQRHKYVFRLYEKDELYDLEKDPAEQNNEIDNPHYAETAAALRYRILEWYTETCDTVPRIPDKR